MHEKIYGIHKGHIEKFISRIREDLYAETVPLQAEYAVSREPVKFRDRRKLRYKKIGEGELWGHEWESAWFHMQGVVPKAWKGREIALHLNLSGESMLFDAQGVPVYAFSAGSAFDTLFVRERYVFPKTAEGGSIWTSGWKRRQIFCSASIWTRNRARTPPARTGISRHMRIPCVWPSSTGRSGSF